MHVLIIILRILGYIMLIWLVLLLLLLTMPICYRFELKKDDNPFFAKGRVTYNLKALLFEIGYVDEEFYYRLKILGKQILSNEPKEPPAPEEAPEETPAEEPEEEPEEAEPEKEEPEEDIQEQQQIHEQEALKEEEPETPAEEISEEASEEAPEEEKEPKPSIFDKINELTDKVNELKKKEEKLRKTYEALGGEELVAKLWLGLKKLIGHILPRKINGYMKYGLDDPAATGYITAALAPFYPVYGRHFSLEPDFYEETFEADCEGSGKIFPIYIMYLTFWLLLDKNVRKLIIYLRWRKRKRK